VPVSLSVHDYGDAALLVDVTGDDAERNWSLTQALGDAVRRHPDVTDVVATYHHVFVAYDPLRVEPREIHSLITEFTSTPLVEHVPRRLTVPVVYGGDCGPDLGAVAEHAGMDVQGVIDVHSGADWVVRFVGSPVGAPFLEGPALPTSVPRLGEPRVAVPTGSVALSGFQSMIYNAPSPGGWQIIGRTTLRPFVIDREPHLPYRPGDVIRFRPVKGSR
jgi:5-oxoprolinase (ATP-hydrolysing) subunit B